MKQYITNRFYFVEDGQIKNGTLCVSLDLERKGFLKFNADGYNDVHTAEKFIIEYKNGEFHYIIDDKLFSHKEDLLL